VNRSSALSPRALAVRGFKTLEKGNLDKLFDNNRKWVEAKTTEDPEYFKKRAQGQSPQYLLIGCADSRMPAQEILGLRCGELFVHRNIANVVAPGDISLLSVLQYSIDVLKVQDVIVMGHYFCGGVKAASLNQEHGLLEHWLINIRDVLNTHKDELAAITDEDQKFKRQVELNVQEQCINLFTNPIVQNAQKTTGFPRIHGFVYDISEGIIQELDIDFKSKIDPIKKAYSVC